MGTAPGRLSTPTTGSPSPAAHSTNSSVVEWWRMCWYTSVIIAPRRFQRLRPTMCTAAAAKALAVRTTVPMLRSCSQFSMATWNGCLRASRSALMASTLQ